ncbi:MAG: hypothetical protein AAB536_01680 [Patescibacteria group bacterium]
MNEEGKLGYLDPIAITAFVAAFMGDLAFIFAWGAIIPVIGLVILAAVLAMHYLTGLIMGALVIPNLNGFIPKLVVVAGIIIPLPTLVLFLFIGMLLQIKLVQTVAITAVGIVTGGAGAVAIKGASMAAEAAEGGMAAGEAGAATESAAARAAGKETSTGEKYAGSKPGGVAAKEEIPPEALGEEESPFEKLQDLTQNVQMGEPQGEKEEGETEDVRLDDENNEVDLRKIK